MLTENGMTPDEESRLLAAARQGMEEHKRGDCLEWQPGMYSASKNIDAYK